MWNGGRFPGMIIVHTEDMRPLDAPCVVCLGFFDGVHLGHRALLKAAGELAEEKGLTLCVHTFDKMPAQVTHPDADISLLTTNAEKEALLCAYGCQVLAYSVFSEQMRRMSGQAFFEDILLGKLHAAAVVAGYDHRFGFKGETDTKGLEALCSAHQVALRIVPKVTLPGGETVSSTAVRSALLHHNIPLAEAMLGRKIDHSMGDTRGGRG